MLLINAREKSAVKCLFGQVYPKSPYAAAREKCVIYWCSLAVNTLYHWRLCKQKSPNWCTCASYGGGARAPVLPPTYLNRPTRRGYFGKQEVKVI